MSADGDVAESDPTLAIKYVTLNLATRIAFDIR